MPETCRRRLITEREAYAMSAEGELPPTLTILPTMRKIKIIGKGQELPPVKLSCMTKIAAVAVEKTIRLREAW